MVFTAKKSLGQHFLTDKNIIRKIVNSIGGAGTDRIIEIGPGTGNMTGFLTEKFGDVHAIEIDKRAVELLERTVPAVKIHHKDILTVNWEELVAAAGNTYIVGNLPYYITSPILFNLLEHRNLFKEAVLMMQKEVAERLVAVPSTKQYGILSVQTQLMSTAELLFDVSPGCFSPPPKVMSSVIRLIFDKPPLPCSDNMLKTVVRTAFNQRRKKLSNSLSSVLNGTIPEGFDFSRRAEEWPPKVYANLAEILERTAKIS